jgi:2-oxoglutarate ferredoxin oxidoreductase subunit gamma
VIIEEDLVTVDPGDSALGIPATKLAEGLGRRIVANVIMLGFLSAASELVRHEAVEEAIKTSIRPQTLELNQKAFSAGFEYASQVERAV